MVLRTEKRLSALAVKNFSKTGLYADGGGLYLQITKAGVRSWLFRYMRNGKARGMGLGSCRKVSLSEARVKAAKCREHLDSGLDPLDVKNAGEISKMKPDHATTPSSHSFRKCAEDYIDSHRAGWKSDKHAAQWTATLTTYAYPTIGDMPVEEITAKHIYDILKPIWVIKTETASRLRGRIELVLGWATTLKYREGENPARWRDNLKNLLPEQSKVTKVTHFAALPHAEISSFMASLEKDSSLAAAALRLLILTACRTNEIINATWSEFDVENCQWTIPAQRMKAGNEHRVPLSPKALEVLRHLSAIRQGKFLFSGRDPQKPMSNMAMLQLLRRMNRQDLTAHGFRSTFRDWAAECTSYPREVAEAALAHTLKDKTEAAYRRSDLFEKRALMMLDWGEYCGAGR